MAGPAAGPKGQEASRGLSGTDWSLPYSVFGQVQYVAQTVKSIQLGVPPATTISSPLFRLRRVSRARLSFFWLIFFMLSPSVG